MGRRIGEPFVTFWHLCVCVSPVTETRGLLGSFSWGVLLYFFLTKSSKSKLKKVKCFGAFFLRFLVPIVRLSLDS